MNLLRIYLIYSVSGRSAASDSDMECEGVVIIVVLNMFCTVY